MATRGQAQVRGLTISYVRAGTGSPVVCLHGIGGHAGQWRQQLAGLADAYTVVAWDAPGYGQSDDPPPGWSMADWADHLAGLFDALGLDRAHVIGQSWGGVLAQVFYGRHAARVRSLVLADTFLGGSAANPDSQATLKSRLEAIDTLTPAEYARTRTPALLGTGGTPKLLAELEAMLAAIHPPGYRAAAIALAGADTRDVLERIAVPTLVTCGALDRIVPGAQGARLIDRIPNARRVDFPGAGHLPNMEQPERFNAAVRDFLERVP